jgi:hypothetical protein
VSEDNEKKEGIADLASYIESNFDGLYGSRSLKDKVKAKRGAGFWVRYHGEKY